MKGKERPGSKSILILLGIVFGMISVRVLVCDRFIVRGDSMLPTLSDRDAVFVNKLVLGARIYTDYRFNRHDLHCFRIPGLRKCHTGDILVFNSPFGDNTNRSTISFSINDVWVKRCLGLPGDTLIFSNNRLFNLTSPGIIIPTALYDSFCSIADNNDFPLSDIFMRRFSLEAEKNNSIGSASYLIPRRGLSITVDSLMLKTYALPIEYENNVLPEIGTEYCFKENWFFVVGDNLSRSFDSRHFGPIPESFIIGVVL